MYNKCTYVDISTAKNKEKQSELCNLQTVNLNIRLCLICHPWVTCVTHLQTRESCTQCSYMAPLPQLHVNQEL